MKWIDILAAALLLISVSVASMAAPESVLIGPYKVSFDMGDIGNYTINPQPPIKGENLRGISYTSYNAFINGTSPSRVQLSIQDFSMPVSNDVENAVGGGMKSFSACAEPVTETRTIDGKSGVLGTINCHGSDMYMLQHPLDLNTTDNAMTSAVMILSTYQWDKGTSSLANTIHVEKA